MALKWCEWAETGRLRPKMALTVAQASRPNILSAKMHDNFPQTTNFSN
jgi:hypothetical protein